MGEVGACALGIDARREDELAARQALEQLLAQKQHQPHALHTSSFKRHRKRKMGLEVSA